MSYNKEDGEMAFILHTRTHAHTQIFFYNLSNCCVWLKLSLLDKT